MTAFLQTGTRTFLFWLTIVFCSMALAQNTSVVQISGVVTDPSGAAVPGATIKATQTDTGFNRSAVSASDGSYLLPNLPLGPYRLEVSANGFQAYARTGIVLQVNSNPQINVALNVGPVTEAVQVKANAALVESQNSSVAQVIDQQRVVDLPLNGRQATQLILLSGAATTPPPRDLASSKNYPSSVVVSVAGGQANGTLYLLDGGDHMDKFGEINLPLPFPDALQEFSVQTGALSADYGGRAGAAVNIVTKSGTNTFHGNLFEFLRNTVTNAGDFFTHQRDQLKRNQFGGTVGGPVLRDKLFFFFGYQGTRLRTAPQTINTFVPTQAALRGDFSTMLSSACGTPISLKDPNGGTFQNNFISPSRFNPEALKLLQYIPISNDPCGRYVFAFPIQQDENQYIGRGDWNLSSKQRIYGRYFYTNLNDPALFDGKNLLTTTRPGVNPLVHSLVAGHTYNFGAATLNSLRYTWLLETIRRGPPLNLISASDIGLKLNASPGNFPLVTVNSFFSVGCGTCSLAKFANGTHQIADDLTLIRGRHQLRFGVNYMRIWNDYLVTGGEAGQYTFSGILTGSGLADYMLGRPSSFVNGNVVEFNPVGTDLALYASDSVRLSPRLTLNVGLRWEPYLAPHDIYGRATHFDLGKFIAGQKSTVFKNAPAGLMFPGDPGMPDGGTNSHYANFAPRLGLVWDPKGDGRMTIRTSYSMSYDLSTMQVFDRMGIAPPWGNTVTLDAPVGGFTDPWAGIPGGNPFPTPLPPPGDIKFAQGGQYPTYPLDIKPMSTQSWTLALQRQVGADWLLSASYIGNKSTHRWLDVQDNGGVYIPGTCGTAACSTAGNIQSRRILSQINPTEGLLISSLTRLDDGGNANYNGLLLSTQRRFSANFSLLANYTWSHCISDGEYNSEVIGSQYQNPNNRAADRGNCESDARHIFNSSMVVQSPRFQGQNSALRYALSNWQLSTIITAKTGRYVEIVSGRDNTLSGIGHDRPDVIGDPHLDNQSVQEWFNPAAFRNNATGAFGNAGRDTILAPGAFDFDLALVRSFPIHEAHTLQFRFEAFNVLNHPSLGAPIVSLANQRLGAITTTGDPRIFQFALKYSF
ncbi:MAG: carboxypeptidase regulatory-like domain-containing protein [Acidobacteriia bacterium]|nr:carboxypeptidase regulatory-like domain-containing protein [Terriglobia bacterium]